MAAAVRRKDDSYDGIFWVGVTTTRIFCRPSCPSRAARPDHLLFFASPEEARTAGLRPCLRCRPEDTGGSPAWVTSLLERLQAEPARRFTGRDLRGLGIDPARARRWFRRAYGMTFQAFARRRRLGQALDGLRRGTDLDEVAMGSGFESHSGFRTAFARTFGGAPGRSRALESITVTWIDSPVGPLLAGVTEEAICLLEFSDRRVLPVLMENLRRRFDRAIVPGEHPLLERLRQELGEYFTGHRRTFTLPLALRGTPFQTKVWAALQAIPWGTTISYQQLAWSVGKPGAVRAVGQANGQNPIAIVVPCHRVVNSDGKLGGYGGGLWRKQLLLDLERSGQVAMMLPSAVGN
jgi:AraC family transcriptional regulator of adaptative response/methylated-DNA-[protein]-cysteine methyltransferase